MKDPSIRPINTTKEAENERTAEQSLVEAHKSDGLLLTPAFEGRDDGLRLPDRSYDQQYEEAFFLMLVLQRNATPTDEDFVRLGRCLSEVDAKYQREVNAAQKEVDEAKAAAGPPSAATGGGAGAASPSSSPATSGGGGAASSSSSPATGSGGAPAPAAAVTSPAVAAAEARLEEIKKKYKDYKNKADRDAEDLLRTTEEEIRKWRHFGNRQGLMLCFTKPEEPINLGGLLANRMDDVLPGPAFPEAFYRSFLNEAKARKFDVSLAAHIAHATTDGQIAGHELVLRAASTILRTASDGVVEYAKWIEWCTGWCIDSEDVRIMTEAVDAIQWFETLEAAAGVKAGTSFARLIMGMDQPALQKATESQCETWLRFTVASSIATTMAYEFMRSAKNPNVPGSLSKLERTQLVTRVRSAFQTIIERWREAYFSATR